MVFRRHARLLAESRARALLQLLLLPQDCRQIGNARLTGKDLVWGLRWRTQAVDALVFARVRERVQIRSVNQFLLLCWLLVPSALVRHHGRDAHLDILLLNADRARHVFGRFLLL